MLSSNLSVCSCCTAFSFPFSQRTHSLLHLVFWFFLFSRSGMQDPISLHLLIPKSKLVSMRNWEECVLLTFFVEYICTSCSSNPKQPTASLIKSSPWRLLSGAQVSSKKQHVHMNATNDHMLKGVDPQPVSCDPFLRMIQIILARLWHRNDVNVRITIKHLAPIN